MLLAILAAVACLASAFCQLVAVMRPYGEHQILRVARRITAVALFVAAVYIGYSLYHSGTVHTLFTLVVGLFALGQMLFVMHTFMGPQQATYLIQSASQRKGPSHATHA